MPRKLKLSELAEFDPSKYLDDDEAVAEYVRLAIEDGDPRLLAAAQGDVARARALALRHRTASRIETRGFTRERDPDDRGEE